MAAPPTAQSATTTPTLTGNISSDGSNGQFVIYSAGWQSGTNNLIFRGNTIALQNQSFSVWGANGGNVDSIAQAYQQATTLSNATLTTNANIYVGRGALQVQGSSNVTVAGQLLASSDWAGFSMQDTSSVTVAGGINFVNGCVATDLALNGGTLTTPFIYGNDYGGSTHVTFNGVEVVATGDNADFLQVHLNGGGAYTAAALIANGGLTFNDGGHNITINNLLYDYPGQSGSLTKVGSGTLTLTRYNGYSGGTIVNQGTLQLNVGGQTGTLANNSNVTVNAGGTLLCNATDALGWGTNPGAVNLTINSGGIVNVTAGNRVTLWNTVNVTGGTLTSAAGTGDGSGNYSLYGQLNATSDASGNPAAISATQLGLQAGNTVFNVTRGSGAVDLVVSSVVSSWTSGAGLTLQGGGIMALSNAANTYSGVTIFAGGILNVASLADYGQNSSLGNRGIGVDGSQNVGLLFRGGTLQYTGSTVQSTNRGIRINANGGDGYAGGATIDASGSNPGATLSFTAAASPDFFEEPGTRALTLTGSNTGSNVFAMAIGEVGSTSLVKSGPGLWVISGANSYSGGTTINGGTLQVGTGSSGSLGSGTTLNNGTLIWNNSNGLAVNSGNAITGNGGLTVDSGIVQVHYDAGGSVSSGPITVDGTTSSNNASFEIWAPNPLTLNNNFVLNSMGPYQARGAINQDGGAGLVTLIGSITLAGNSRIGAGGSTWNSMVITGQLSGSGSLYVYENTSDNSVNFPATTLVLTNAANSNSGGITIENGRLSITSATALGTATVTNTSGGGELLIDEVSGTVPNNIVLAGANPGGVGYSYGSAALILHNDGKTLTFSGSITLAGDTKIRGYSAGGTTTFSQPIGGPGGVTFEAGGAVSTHTQYWNLQGSPSTYGGNTTVASDGYANSYLRLQGGNLPSTTSLTLQDSSSVGGNNAVFDLNGGTQTLAGLNNVHGAGGLGSFVTNSGSGAGQALLTVGSGNFSGIIGANTAAGATGQGPGGDNIALDKTGNGTLVLAGANTYSGGTTVNGGVLQLGNNSALGTGGLTVNSGGTLDLNGTPVPVVSALWGTGVIGNSSLGTPAVLNYDNSTTSSTFGGTIQDSVGGGSSTTGLYVGSGTLTLTGPNTHSGTTTVDGGVLVAGASNTLSAYSGHIIDSGTLDVTNAPQTIKSLTMSGGTLNIQYGNLLTSRHGHFQRRHA